MYIYIALQAICLSINLYIILRQTIFLSNICIYIALQAMCLSINLYIILRQTIFLSNICIYIALQAICLSINLYIDHVHCTLSICSSNIYRPIVLFIKMYRLLLKLSCLMLQLMYYTHTCPGLYTLQGGSINK